MYFHRTILDRLYIDHIVGIHLGIEANGPRVRQRDLEWDAKLQPRRDSLCSSLDTALKDAWMMPIIVTTYITMNESATLKVA